MNKKHLLTTISVVIPTLNRPDLLREAITSIKAQSRTANEIIVVDDGSDKPVSEARLTEEFGQGITVLRNEYPHGLAWARNQGVEFASSELVAHLDDDDIYAPETLEEAAQLLDNDTAIDMVFIGVEGFGKRAPYFNNVQHEAVKKVIDCGKGNEAQSDFFFFDEQLINALLITIPSAFQHVVIRKKVWLSVSMLRRRAYMLDSDISNDIEASHRITGPLRDSEWALYAAAICKKTVLINRPRYLARCDEQGMTSKPSHKEKHINQMVNIKTQLYKASRALPEFSALKHQIKKSLATIYFDTAYYYFYNKNKRLAWTFIYKTLMISAKFSYLKFALRMLLPVKVNNE